MGRRVCVVLVALLLTQCAAAADGGDSGQVDIAGVASVLDGDTLIIAGHRIRLFGVDAPELDQRCQRNSGASWPCGTAAKAALANIVDGRRLRCTQKDVDRYRRIVAVCRIGNRDLNAALTAAGWALAYRDYSDDYLKDEEQARAARRGLWNGTFENPWDYRRADERTAATPAPNAANCRIKGNISSNGDRIYHMNGGEFYDRTTINTSLGERWFCSEGEAKAAGWRKSRR